jgi:hypothetical protein
MLDEARLHVQVGKAGSSIEAPDPDVDEIEVLGSAYRGQRRLALGDDLANRAGTQILAQDDARAAPFGIVAIVECDVERLCVTSVRLALEAIETVSTHE